MKFAKIRQYLVRGGWSFLKRSPDPRDQVSSNSYEDGCCGQKQNDLNRGSLKKVGHRHFAACKHYFVRKRYDIDKRRLARKRPRVPLTRTATVLCPSPLIESTIPNRCR